MKIDIAKSNLDFIHCSQIKYFRAKFKNFDIAAGRIGGVFR